jgi:hypothetical protein
MASNSRHRSGVLLADPYDDRNSGVSACHVMLSGVEVRVMTVPDRLFHP